MGTLLFYIRLTGFLGRPVTGLELRDIFPLKTTYRKSFKMLGLKPQIGFEQIGYQ